MIKCIFHGAYSKNTVNVLKIWVTSSKEVTSSRGVISSRGIAKSLRERQALGYPSSGDN